MKKLFILAFIFTGFVQAQSNTELQKHYEAYYKAMKNQGDASGIIEALTHLNVMSPSVARKDTLAMVYAQGKQYNQALNTIGIEIDPADSDMAVRIKAISLKAIGQPQRAISQFEVLYKRKPNTYIAYELADLKIQTADAAGADPLIDYGITNAKAEEQYAFYERQQPYQVPIKAAFLHLKALSQYNKDKNIDAAVLLIDQALIVAPHFNLASLSKQALEKRKEQAEAKE